MSSSGTWRVLTASVDELEEHLNTLARDGFDVFAILPMGGPEPLSRVPREHKSLEERTTFAVIARRPPA
jgi:hypothetical protein